MPHPQEVPLVKLECGAFVPTVAQHTVRVDLDEMADQGLDTQAYEHAYRTQLSRQMNELSRGNE